MWPFRKTKKKESPPVVENFTDVSADDKYLKVISLLPPEVGMQKGMPGVAVCGFMTPEGFRPNRGFIDFMQKVIQEHGPSDPELQAFARYQREGYAYIIDLRTPEGPQGRVPPEDVVGGFEVSGGQLGEYRANPNYRVYTENGLVTLPPALQKILITRLVEAANEMSGEPNNQRR